jgi:thiamine-phosphate diphosphorylase / hydroxyethylthiazole kinase
MPLTEVSRAAFTTQTRCIPNKEQGVTIVQYRDKTSDTADLIRTAKGLHEITRAHNIPLLINDRVDVAIAVGAEGVHVGQDDMGKCRQYREPRLMESMALSREIDANVLSPDLATARNLLGPKAIIGVTASSVDEALRAAKDGADYLGLGTVFATPT